MLDEEIITYLSEIKSDLKFQRLLEHLKASGVIFKNKRLRGVSGMTTFDCIYIDVETIKCGFAHELVYFIFLDELAHYKRVSKYGKDYFLNRLSNNDATTLYEYLMLEEDIADRYALMLYNKFNEKSIPSYLNVVLKSQDRKSSYALTAKELVGQINNDEKNYNRLMESYIL